MKRSDLQAISEASHRWRIYPALFFSLFAIYWASPNHIVVDSEYSIHTSVSLLRGYWGSLENYETHPEETNVIEVDGKPFNYHPIGVSVISLPLVWLGMEVYPPLLPTLQGVGHSKFEYVVSSFWAAALVASFFHLLIAVGLARVPALVTTVMFALGTSVWSLAAMALWQHGPLMLMHVWTLYWLHRALDDDRYAKYAGLTLALAFIIRPTAAIPVVVFSAYVLFGHRRCLPAFLALAGLIAIPWLAYNWAIYDAIMPPSYLGRGPYFTFYNVAEGLAGTLVSPSRGLLIYSPAVLLAGPGLALGWRNTRLRALYRCILAIILGHWLLVSSWPHWWGGHCYGPRMMSDLLPFLFLFVGLCVGWLLEERSAASSRSAIGLWFLGAAFAWSLFVHAQGAIFNGPTDWNNAPVDVQDWQDRLWSWTDPPYFRFSGI